MMNGRSRFIDVHSLFIVWMAMSWCGPLSRLATLASVLFFDEPPTSEHTAHSADNVWHGSLGWSATDFCSYWWYDRHSWYNNHRSTLYFWNSFELVGMNQKNNSTLLICSAYFDHLCQAGWKHRENKELVFIVAGCVPRWAPQINWLSLIKWSILISWVASKITPSPVERWAVNQRGSVASFWK